MEAEPRVTLDQTTWWRSKDGFVLPLAHLAREHKINVLRLLWRRRERLQYQEEMSFATSMMGDLGDDGVDFYDQPVDDWLWSKPLVKQLALLVIIDRAMDVSSYVNDLNDEVDQYPENEGELRDDAADSVQLVHRTVVDTVTMLAELMPSMARTVATDIAELHTVPGTRAPRRHTIYDDEL